jgi:hypothetical protein
MAMTATLWTPKMIDLVQRPQRGRTRTVPKPQAGCASSVPGQGTPEVNFCNQALSLIDLDLGPFLTTFVLD